MVCLLFLPTLLNHAMCSTTSLHMKEWWRIWLRPLTFWVVSFLASTHNSWWVWNYILPIFWNNHHSWPLQEPGMAIHMTVHPCSSTGGTTLAWYWLHFGHRARPVLGMILRLLLRTPNPRFMELTTSGLVEIVAFLMPLLRTQLSQAYVLMILLQIQLLFWTYVVIP